ncbi:shikimate dehydrogenase [Enterococcus faecalis 13-SD-W-01]|nr:shikimate dehydrogenase [Enterococcus faecalis 13-SD-W-01]
MITGSTKLAGLFASPAAHSLSPFIHNKSFEVNEINAVYLAFDVDNQRLPQAVESIRTFDMLGANLSMPNKKAVFPLLDAISEEAQLIGAVNTIVHKNGKLIGYNTDGRGFWQSADEAGVQWEDEKAVILGAGGAAKAIAVQAALDGIGEITIYKRKNATFAQTVRFFEDIAKQTSCPIRVIDFSDEKQLAKDLAESRLLINATDIGMGSKKDETPLTHPEMFSAKLAVADLIYAPSETRLLKEAKHAGAVTLNGLGMLLHQGAAAFELWTGKKMPIETIRKELEQKEQNNDHHNENRS